MKRMPSCAEVADGLEALPTTLREARRIKGLSLRDVADQSGVGYTTAWRIESGKGCELASAVALLRWLANPEPEPKEQQ